MAHSLHSILTDVFDRSNRAIRAIFESGGGSTAWSTHTVVRAVYDQTLSAIRITDITPVGHFGAYLAVDKSTNGLTEVPIPWTAHVKEGVTHADGVSSMVLDNAGNYTIHVDLVADFNVADKIHYVALQKGS